jgi:hypothetical protein
VTEAMGLCPEVLTRLRTLAYHAHHTLSNVQKHIAPKREALTAG